MSALDDAVEDLANDMLSENGQSFVYVRGTTSTTVTLIRSQQQSVYVDDGDGHITEVQPVDFLCLTTALPYAVPKRGDRIAGDGMTYELQPTVGESVFRQINPMMTRLHAKRVK